MGQAFYYQAMGWACLLLALGAGTAAPATFDPAKEAGPNQVPPAPVQTEGLAKSTKKPDPARPRGWKPADENVRVAWTFGFGGANTRSALVERYRYDQEFVPNTRGLATGDISAFYPWSQRYGGSFELGAVASWQGFVLEGLHDVVGAGWRYGRTSLRASEVSRLTASLEADYGTNRSELLVGREFDFGRGLTLVPLIGARRVHNTASIEEISSDQTTAPQRNVVEFMEKDIDETLRGVIYGARYSWQIDDTWTLMVGYRRFDLRGQQNLRAIGLASGTVSSMPHEALLLQPMDSSMRQSGHRLRAEISALVDTKVRLYLSMTQDSSIVTYSKVTLSFIEVSKLSGATGVVDFGRYFGTRHPDRSLATVFGIIYLADFGEVSLPHRERPQAN